MRTHKDLDVWKEAVEFVERVNRIIIMNINKFRYEKLFLSSVILKICLIFTFSSEYITLLFYPFLKSFTFQNLNPWEYYFVNNLNLDSFPYHGLMLFILKPFVFLGHDSLLKLPLLMADVGILYILLKMFPHKQNNVYLFYFFNPIVIYAIYVHSQLDIIPTALFFTSTYLLSLKKLKYSALFFGLALATKLHVAIALPLILFYLYRNNDIKNVIKYFFITISTLLIFDLPFIFSDGFVHMVLMNPKQFLLFNTFYSIGSLKLLLPVAAIVVVYFHFFNQQKVNDDLLFFYFGLLFTATIFLIYPGPAWYVWMVPFISIYFIKNSNNKKTFFFYSTYSVAYLIFFIFFYKSEYKDILFLGKELNLKIDDENFRNLSFTILESVILAILYSFYNYGIKSNSIYKKQTNFVIGIGGDSGVGKSTLLLNLKNILGTKLLQIEGDGEHKWERGDENWNKYTHLDPKANHIHNLAEIIHKLKHNQAIYRREYDHTTGKFTKPQKVEPKEFIVLAGLHPFYLPKLRKTIDLKIYIDTDENLRRHWKILRDTKERGYSIEKILKQIESRMEDAKKYIYPQKDFADMIINFFPINNLDLDNENAEVNIGLKITLDANVHIEGILEKFMFDFVWDYNDDLKTQYIEIRSIPQVNFEDIANDTIDNINEIIAIDAKWSKGYNGLIQLITLKIISEKLKEEKE
jgi:uridine kinase